MLLPFGLKGNMHLNICLSLPIQKENIPGKRIGYCIWFYAHRMIEQIFPQKCAKCNSNTFQIKGFMLSFISR